MSESRPSSPLLLREWPSRAARRPIAMSLPCKVAEIKRTFGRTMSVATRACGVCCACCARYAQDYLSCPPNAPICELLKVGGASSSLRPHIYYYSLQ